MTDKKKKFNNKDLALGLVFKRTRQAKGFSQKEAAGDEISCNHLSSFENGHAILATHHFLAILRNINMELSEFQYAYHAYLNRQDDLFFSEQITEAYTNRSVAQLKNIRNKVNAVLETNPYLKKYRLDKSHIEIGLSILDDTYKMARQELTYLSDYLLNLKEWGRTDIILLNHAAIFLSTPTLYELTNHLIKPTQIGTDLADTQPVLVQTVLEVIHVLISRKADDLAEEFIRYLEKNQLPDCDMYEKLLLIYHKYLIAYRQGEQTALNGIKTCRKILLFCGCLELADLMAQEIPELEDDRENL
jgi:Rgg/GadR/MutR family transcriptional activator